jgi:succinyl-CoA synthetase alpha subunit
MSVLINEITSVICLGITGSQGTFHTEHKTVHRAKLVGSLGGHLAQFWRNLSGGKGKI